jgi:protein SCO1/2
MVSIQNPTRKAGCEGVYMAAWLLVLLAAARAGAVSDDALGQVRFDQKLDTQVSLSLSFRDETGREINLGQYFGSKPVVLILGYYECPMLCTLVLNGFLESAADMKWSIGREFEVVDVSVNPRETPKLAAAKKRTYLKRYGRPGASEGWHFLTGDEPTIRQLADEVGFRFLYDPESKQFAHPSGLIILTTEGKVSAYIFGVTYGSKGLLDSLQKASSKQIGSPIKQFILLCFHYNPITGKYSGTIMTSLRLLSVAFLAGVCGLTIRLARRKREAPPGTEPQALEPSATLQPEEKLP